MPRWKALPEDLDPQIREFTSQLRRLVDRSGLSIAALADRTGYGRTSWERYLGGRLLAPKGAVVALAEVTGTNPVHLVTLWELAERAWSRAEMRHDSTMEAIRISQARAALGELGELGEAGDSGEPGRETSDSADRGSGDTAAPPGSAGPADAVPAVFAQPTLPAQPTVPDASVDAHAGAREGAGHGPAHGTGGQDVSGPATAPADGAASDGNSWGLAGYQGPSRAGAHPGRRPDGPGTSGPHPAEPAESRPGPAADRAVDRHRLAAFLAGLVGVLVLIGAVFYFTGQGGGGKEGHPATSPSPVTSTHVSLPAGVKCAGPACNGKDAEVMHCSGDLVTTAKSTTVGAITLEVRYSKTCGAAWGRITGAAPGDRVQVSVGGERQTADATAAGDTIAYTPMVAVRDATEARACVTLASGPTGCTR
ncbi:XRE family transcriptional regulator [Streptomyces sp. MUM 16J]|uniref:helix-turn-helix domain-containing protein n=1 Tax=Streptomyces sp. MUM 16J TaxID=2791988 RepID=UPI001F0390B6|nr:XRE family transcriptional regulator [Streptomyces sp. MUM 16J]MCH0556396.1 DUF2690 domain-containing protein [Streptomyces sp. MUM 16J]